MFEDIKPLDAASRLSRPPLHFFHQICLFSV
jgi:hypothetical protein